MPISAPSSALRPHDREPTSGLVGCVRDLLSARPPDWQELAVAPNDSLVVAYARMRVQNASRLVVLKRGAVCGVIDEAVVLCAAIEDPRRLQIKVREMMSRSIEVVDLATPLEDLVALLSAGVAPVVVEGGAFRGLVTHSDIIRCLRRRAREAAHL